MAKATLSPELREAVRQRAANCCEYCKSQDKYSPATFTIDHIWPESMDGTSHLMNLAYACFLCNRFKSNKLKIYDILTKQWIPLYNPRKDLWHEHFIWNKDTTKIIGVTTIGRCTVIALKLNRDKLVEYRNSIMPLGTHPPKI